MTTCVSRVYILHDYKTVARNKPTQWERSDVVLVHEEPLHGDQQVQTWPLSMLRAGLAPVLASLAPPVGLVYIVYTIMNVALIKLAVIYVYSNQITPFVIHS